MDTKRKILNTARQLLNQEGLKAVTVREICKELKISPGSFSYHFPDKSDILRTLYQEMVAEGTANLAAMAETAPHVTQYLDAHVLHFKLQEKYKFFYLNQFEIFKQHADIRVLYLANTATERQMAKGMLRHYMAEGILRKTISEAELDRIVNVGQILNNFWPVDAAISPPEGPQLPHYMKICCGLLEPYLEPDSLAAYHAYFERLEAASPGK